MNLDHLAFFLILPFIGLAVWWSAHFFKQKKDFNRFRKELIVNVTHEFLTPLTVIRGYTETVMNEEISDSEKKSFLTTIQTHTDYLIKMVENLLTLARLEKIKPRETIGLVDLPFLFEEWEKKFLPRLKSKKIEWSVNLASPLVRFETNLSLLELIFTNLIDNAIKYSSEGGKIEIKGERKHSMIHFEVKDRGIGIAPENQIRIFERFYRVHKDRDKQTGGTGLGLALVKHAVALLGGDITVETELGKGSTFCFSVKEFL